MTSIIEKIIDQEQVDYINMSHRGQNIQLVRVSLAGTAIEEAYFKSARIEVLDGYQYLVIAVEPSYVVWTTPSKCALSEEGWLHEGELYISLTGIERIEPTSSGARLVWGSDFYYEPALGRMSIELRLR